MLCRHVCIFPAMPSGSCPCPQAITDEVQGMMPLRLGSCGNGVEAPSSLPRKPCPCRVILTHPSAFLPTLLGSWNLRLTLLCPCSWAHLLRTLFFYLWACGTGTTKIFLQRLTSIASNLWLHYLLLELRLHRLALLGHQLNFLFHIVVYPSFVQ